MQPSYLCSLFLLIVFFLDKVVLLKSRHSCWPVSGCNCQLRNLDVLAREMFLRQLCVYFAFAVGFLMQLCLSVHPVWARHYHQLAWPSCCLPNCVCGAQQTEQIIFKFLSFSCYSRGTQFSACCLILLTLLADYIPEANRTCFKNKCLE